MTIKGNLVTVMIIGLKLVKIENWKLQTLKINNRECNCRYRQPGDDHDLWVKTCENLKLKTESGADCNHRVIVFENWK